LVKATTLRRASFATASKLITDDAKVEALDLFESTHGTLNTLLKQTYLRRSLTPGHKSPLKRCLFSRPATGADMQSRAQAQTGE
jgi:hypothetical protein